MGDGKPIVKLLLATHITSINLGRLRRANSSGPDSVASKSTDVTDGAKEKNKYESNNDCIVTACTRAGNRLPRFLAAMGTSGGLSTAEPGSWPR
jgi:hypothetical protein